MQHFKNTSKNKNVHIIVSKPCKTVIKCENHWKLLVHHKNFKWLFTFSKMHMYTYSQLVVHIQYNTIHYIQNTAYLHTYLK